MKAKRLPPATVPYLCCLCRAACQAVLGTLLAMLAVCAPCQSARFEKGLLAAKAGQL